MSFDRLGLDEALLRAVRAQGYREPTPIQAGAIPPALAGRDILGTAQTGTGKTAAFVLPLLQRLAPGGQRASAGTQLATLILTPTRELAAQIGMSIATYGAHLPLTHTVIYGGVGQNPQVQALRRGVDLLVACPGRLLDLMGQGEVDLGQLQAFVLDEADRMLDMGFIHDVRKIVARLPERRQTLFFSATMPTDVRKLADGLLHDPVDVAVAPVSSTADTVDQQLYHVIKGHKTALLRHLLRDRAMQRTLVFSRTKHGADRIARQLGKQGVEAGVIHGNKSQNQRTRALEAFRAGRTRVLIASDIAARGIDIDGITHVVNYELPHEPETYVHRIGRTGRAGRSGRSISFCDPEELPRLKQIQRLTAMTIPVVDDHPFAGQEAPAPGPVGAPPRSARPPVARHPGGSSRNRRRRTGRQQGTD